MLVSAKNKKTGGKKETLAVVDPKVGNYEKHPFFVKKANEAKSFAESCWFAEEIGKSEIILHSIL